MTDIGGTKTVYAPVTPKVDNNAKPSTGTSNGPVSPGLLQPGPNTTWVEDVAEQPRAPAWQKAQVSEEAKDRRQSALANGTAITIGHLSPQIQQQTNAAIAGLAARQDEQSGSASGTGSNPSVEDAHESIKKSLDTEARHDEQVAKTADDNLELLRAEDKKLAASQA